MTMDELERRYQQQRTLHAAEKAAQLRRAKEKAERKAAEKAALEASLKRVADAKIAEIRASAIRNYAGTPAEFERDWPKILEAHRIAAAAGLLPPQPPIEPDPVF